MPTAKPEWTTERPDEPGFYWWIRLGGRPEVVEVYRTELANGSLFWTWYETAVEDEYNDGNEPPGSLWWPVRLDPPPVG